MPQKTNSVVSSDLGNARLDSSAKLETAWIGSFAKLELAVLGAASMLRDIKNTHTFYTDKELAEVAYGLDMIFRDYKAAVDEYIDSL